MTTTPNLRPRVLPLLLAGCVLLLLGAWWKQRSEVTRIRQENDRLQEQFRQLKHQVGEAEAAIEHHPSAQPETARAESLGAPTADATEPVEPSPPPAPPAPRLVRIASGMAPEPRSSGLTLAGTHVTPVEGGLQTALSFNPTDTEPLGIIAIVVRLPIDGESQILGLAPAGSVTYADVMQRVSEDGKFAVFQGTAQNSGPVEFALSVTRPAVADVRGTAGIGPFDLRIDEHGAIAQPK